MITLYHCYFKGGIDMPAAYAHYTFGKKVLATTENPEIRRIITEHRALFDIGLHGPDILFFYRPLKSTPVSKTGHLMHAEIAAPFFRQARRVINRSSNREASIAYILGFICHYSLDSECHGYIGEMTKTGISHTEIETEFDRSILLRCKKDPITTKTLAHIQVNKELSDCIAQFFPAISEKEMFEALKSFRFYNNFLISSCKIRRAVINTSFRLSGNYEELHGLVMNFHRNPDCAPICRRLSHLYINAIPVGVRLMENFYDALSTGDPLDERFDRNFE